MNDDSNKDVYKKLSVRSSEQKQTWGRVYFISGLELTSKHLAAKPARDMRQAFRTDLRAQSDTTRIIPGMNKERGCQDSLSKI